MLKIYLLHILVVCSHLLIYHTDNHSVQTSGQDLKCLNIIIPERLTGSNKIKPPLTAHRAPQRLSSLRGGFEASPCPVVTFTGTAYPFMLKTVSSNFGSWEGKYNLLMRKTKSVRDVLCRGCSVARHSGCLFPRVGSLGNSPTSALELFTCFDIDFLLCPDEGASLPFSPV